MWSLPADASFEGVVGDSGLAPEGPCFLASPCLRRTLAPHDHHGIEPRGRQSAEFKDGQLLVLVPRSKQLGEMLASLTSDEARQVGRLDQSINLE